MADCLVPQVRAFLLHLTHYDPVWCRAKGRERPFDLDLALELVDTMAEEGFNLLVIDCADAVRYRSHPELAKRYTVPMSHLETLAARAVDLGVEVVPKLNFSRSATNRHSEWMRVKDEEWFIPFDEPEAHWNMAFELIDELTAACRDVRSFHIGMDEDHQRSLKQYADDIALLHARLEERNLRTLMWNDSGITTYASGHVHAEKAVYAEQHIPADVVQVLWQYRVVPSENIRRIRVAGFELWGAPGRDPEQARQFRNEVLQAGGTGLLMTYWIPCRKSNRAELLRALRTLGPVYRGE